MVMLLMLFSIFSEFSLMWNFFQYSVPLLLFMVIYIFKFLSSKLMMKTKYLLFMIVKILSDSFINKLFNNMKLFLMVTLFYIICINISSLILPHFTKLSVHLHFTVVLSFLSWIALMISTTFKNFSYFIQHSVPTGSPLSLSFSLFFIENISNLVRPLTLSFRICAIMSSANIIMNLSLSFILTFFPFFDYNFMNVAIMGVFSPIIMILFFYDILICFIQGYIFVSLVNSYSEEHS